MYGTLRVDFDIREALEDVHIQRTPEIYRCTTPRSHYCVPNRSSRFVNTRDTGLTRLFVQDGGMVELQYHALHSDLSNGRIKLDRLLL